MPAVLLYFLLRCCRDPRYRRSLPQRFGRLPTSIRLIPPGAFWLHAVSVGEVLSAVPLIHALREQWPAIPVVLSTSTLAGRAMAEQKLADITAARIYAPLDYAFAVRRALRMIRPSLLIVIETEIWPNLFREAKRFGCGLMLVSGRISDNTADRYRRLRIVFRSALSFPDMILVQSETMRDRFIAAGATPERVTVSGNLKYDLEPGALPPDSPIRDWLAKQSTPVCIAASTSVSEGIDEDDAVLAAWRDLPGWRLILAPRKPERFDVVAHKLEAAGVAFVRRSQLHPASAEPVLLLDTLGELSALFSLANVVFMGGTLADRGGHNILEPAFFGRPIAVGPHLENFQDIADDFLAHSALIQIQDRTELAGALRSALENQEVGQRAQERSRIAAGAAKRATSAAEQLLATVVPHGYPTTGQRFFLTPLAWLWRAASVVNTRRSLRFQRALSTPVISVGNLSVGGTGKTPLVLHLAERLRAAGYAPAILSRGYGRASHHKALVFEAGAQANVTHTGDEPQIFLKSGLAPLGIGGNRFAVGQQMEARFHPGVFLLDDGYQHRRLARALDIVLVDALDPFGNGCLLPLGRLREPVTALSRAGAFLLTRTEAAVSLIAIERRLGQINPQAPIFRSRTVARHWVRFDSGEQSPAGSFEGQPVIAFCGLGNPQSFWGTLQGLGVHIAERFAFDDHHRYTPGELRRLLHSARTAGTRVMVTTQKDIINLCEGCPSLLPGIELYGLKIEFEIEREGELFGLCTDVLEGSKAPLIKGSRSR